MGPTARPQAAALVLLLATAGCVGGLANDDASAPRAADLDESYFVRGLVVDSEFVPVADAAVTAAPGDWVATTGPDGAFELGPLAPATYRVEASKPGYKASALDVVVAQASPERLLITLIPVASHVPYHTTVLFVALLDCSWATFGATFPCIPIDRVTGQNITGDRSRWKFQIPDPGLANLLHEMEWKPQATGRDMKISITEPNQPVFIGGVTKFYLFRFGGSPLRSWLWPGQIAPGGSVPFDGNQSAKYDAFIRGSETNHTIPFVLYIEQRANNWFTFFYNRPGPPDFTALPDK